jgi:hypothetical protein
LVFLALSSDYSPSFFQLGDLRIHTSSKHTPSMARQHAPHSRGHKALGFSSISAGQNVHCLSSTVVPSPCWWGGKLLTFACMLFVAPVCFTVCLCFSPDLDGYQGTKNETLSPERPTRYVFTICLCISPDLDGNRGTTKMCPGRPTKGPQTQIRSHRTAGASNHRLP